MLKIVNFSKQYGSKIAVSNLNLLVQKGDIMGFIGKNGAGKTTTLKACMGIIRPTTGDIYVNDVSILANPIDCKREMAFVPDTPMLEEYMTGIQYLNFICDIYRVPVKTRKPIYIHGIFLGDYSQGRCLSLFFLKATVLLSMPLRSGEYSSISDKYPPVKQARHAFHAEQVSRCR